MLHPPYMSAVQLMRSPWRDLLLEAVGRVQQRLLLVSPFITTDVIADIEHCLLAREGRQNIPLDVRVLTRIQFEDFHSGASQMEALEQFLQWPLHHQMWTVQLRAIENIHAKVWVFDDTLAVVGSGNATYSGLGRNVEYGLAVSEVQLVTQILADWQLYWLGATSVSIEDLLPIRQALERLRRDESLRKTQQESSQRQKAILEELHVDTSLGKRVLFPKSQKNQTGVASQGEGIISAVSEQENLSPSEQVVPSLLEAPPVIPPQAICISTYDFWRALNWTFPWTRFGLASWRWEDVYLVIDWLSLPKELQLTRVNGRQLSRATIQGYTLDDMLGDSRATLDEELIWWLGRHLQAMKPGTVARRPLLDALWFVDGLPDIIEIEKAKRPIDAERQIPASHKVAPEWRVKNIPALQEPVSYITVEHIALVEHLKQLERMWEEQHLALEFPNTVELRLCRTDLASALILSVNSLAQSLEVQVPGQDALIADPTVILRLNYATLWQVLDGTLDAVESWHLHIGCDAKQVQFLPANSAQAFSHLWFHQLDSL